MKKINYLTLIVLTTIMSGSAIAQELPQPSPSAKVEQTVGLTKVSIDYSRPGVKERTIFGELVPYGKVWRLGANACTKFTNSTDMLLGSTTLTAGTYAIFAIPAEKGEWTIVFNTDTEQWGAGDYDKAKNVATMKVNAKEHAFTETFTIGFANVTNNSASISFEWENLSVQVPFSVKTNKIFGMAVDEAIANGEDLDKVYYKAASYAFKSLKNNQAALASLEKSFAVKKTHKSLFLKAQVLMADDKKEEAIKAGKEAVKYAKEADANGWADYIEGYIKKWAK